MKSTFQPPAGQFSRFAKPDDKATRHKLNYDIPAKEVRVIDAQGRMLGIMSKSQAIKLAEEQESDLVEIAPQAQPPVCKIIDYGKFLYELQKKEKQQKKNTQQQQVKEIRFKWRTDTHDYNFKMRHARNFISEGNKVKASVMFRGREIVHHEIGKTLLEKFVADLDDISKIDQEIKFEGKNLSVTLTPDKTKKKSDKPEKAEKPVKEQIDNRLREQLEAKLKEV